MLTLIGKFGQYTKLSNERSPRVKINFIDTFYHKLYSDIACHILQLKDSGYIEDIQQQGYDCISICDEYMVRNLLFQHYRFQINLERYMRRFVTKYPTIGGYELFLLERGPELYIAIRV